MRANPILTLLAVTALVGLAAATNAVAAAGSKEPSCSELAAERQFVSQDARRVTGAVEAKNVELGETIDALSVAKAAGRKQELSRRAEGLRRELTVLLDREHEKIDRLGALDSTIAKRCRKGGGK